MPVISFLCFFVVVVFLRTFMKSILQVPYIPASKTQVDNVMKLLRGRQGRLVDLGSGDGRIVRKIRVTFLDTLSLF